MDQLVLVNNASFKAVNLTISENTTISYCGELVEIHLDWVAGLYFDQH